MPYARPNPVRRLGEHFAVDSDWMRPVQPVSRGDVTTGIVVGLASVLTVELSRGMGYFEGDGFSRWFQWTAVLVAAALLVFRRRFPLGVAMLAAAHMFLLGVTDPALMAQVSCQVVYFTCFYSAVAWGRDRRSMLAVVGLITVFMFGWLAWQFAVGNAIQEVTKQVGKYAGYGWLSPVASNIILTFLVNVVFFGGAVALGQVSWRNALQRERLRTQSATIAEQSESLRRKAVIEERLRIARELHDVVAHHVSVIGIQAAAARRVLDRDPAAAKGALGEIEGSSRDAVTQMRGLLGTLRAVDDVAAGDPARTEGSRAPEPGLEALPDLVALHRVGAVSTAYDLVEDPAGSADRLPGAVALSLVRTVQEALANVSRHSTATEVRVVVRVVERQVGSYAEVEVLDNGRPRPGTSGSGLGQLGIRERVASHRGQSEIGPRPAGGYRVRVRLPLGDPPPDPAHGADGLARAGGPS